MTPDQYRSLLAAANCQRDVMNCINGGLGQVDCPEAERRDLMRASIARLEDFATAEGARGACFVAAHLEGAQA